MKNGSSRFTPSEIITLTYILITGLLVLFSWHKVDNAADMLLVRLVVVASVIVMSVAYKRYPIKSLWFLRNFLISWLILYWYPETYYLGKCIMGPLDSFFMSADQWLFGCQPSIEFSKAIPYKWFSELMCFGYFSYFFMILGTAFYFYFCRRSQIQRSIFIILCSFLCYYLIFALVPVMGPQFYFPEPLNSIPDAGIFRYLVKLTQELGEQPTGAFPSSHVAICLINLTLLYKYARKGFYLLLPVALLLICSTVYIKAHYLVDVFAGFITAPFIYWISLTCWKRFERSNTFVERIS